jgi:hypothetical protein
VDATRGSVRPKEDRNERPASGTSRPGFIFRQPGVWITEKWFVVGDRRYYVAELSNLRTARGPRDPFTIKAVVTTGVVLTATGGTMAGASSMGQQMSLGALPALGLAVLVPLALAWLGYRSRPRPFELWAEYKGRTVQLFCSDSERKYGQVCRALLRSREMARLGPAGHTWSSTVDSWRSMPR